MSDAESDQSNACSTGDVGVLLEAWLFVKGLWLHCSIPFASEVHLGQTTSHQQESFMLEFYCKIQRASLFVLMLPGILVSGAQSFFLDESATTQ